MSQKIKILKMFVNTEWCYFKEENKVQGCVTCYVPEIKFIRRRLLQSVVENGFTGKERLQGIFPGEKSIKKLSNISIRNSFQRFP